MIVYQGKYYHVWKMLVNGVIQYGVSKNLCVGAIYLTLDYNDAVDFCKEIDV